MEIFLVPYPFCFLKNSAKLCYKSKSKCKCFLLISGSARPVDDEAEVEIGKNKEYRKRATHAPETTMFLTELLFFFENNMLLWMVLENPLFSFLLLTFFKTTAKLCYAAKTNANVFFFLLFFFKRKVSQNSLSTIMFSAASLSRNAL